MDENAIIVQRLGRFADFFRDYSERPKGPIGLMGPSGGGECDEIALLLQNLTAQAPIKDVDGNTWIPVNKMVVDMVSDALLELERHRKIERSKQAFQKRVEESMRTAIVERNWPDDRGPMGPMGW